MSKLRATSKRTIVVVIVAEVLVLSGCGADEDTTDDLAGVGEVAPC